MTDVKPTTVVQLLREAVDQRGFGGSVEIDHHVAAEDGVELAAERPRIHQIQTSERDERAQSFAHDEGPGPIGPDRLEELAIGVRHIPYGGRRINSARTPGNHFGIDVGGENTDIVTLKIRDFAA